MQLFPVTALPYKNIYFVNFTDKNYLGKKYYCVQPFRK